MTSKTKSKPGHSTKWKVFYFITFLTGIVLLVFEVTIYRSTIIRMIVPVSIITTTGIITFLVSRNHYNETFNTRGVFFPLIQNVVSWGFISCYLFMAINYYAAENELKELRFEIVSKRSMPGPRGRRDARKPLVTIDYFGFKKELVFNYEDTERVKNADKVIVKVKNGFLGFDILHRHDAVDRYSGM